MWLRNVNAPYEVVIEKHQSYSQQHQTTLRKLTLNPDLLPLDCTRFQKDQQTIQDAVDAVFNVQDIGDKYPRVKEETVEEMQQA